MTTSFDPLISTAASARTESPPSPTSSARLTVVPTLVANRFERQFMLFAGRQPADDIFQIFALAVRKTVGKDIANRYAPGFAGADIPYLEVKRNHRTQLHPLRRGKLKLQPWGGDDRFRGRFGHKIHGGHAADLARFDGSDLD